MNTLIRLKKTQNLVLSCYKNTYKNRFSVPVEHKPANIIYKAVCILQPTT